MRKAANGVGHHAGRVGCGRQIGDARRQRDEVLPKPAQPDDLVIQRIAVVVRPSVGPVRWGQAEVQPRCARKRSVRQRNETVQICRRRIIGHRVELVGGRRCHRVDERCAGIEGLLTSPVVDGVHRAVDIGLHEFPVVGGAVGRRHHRNRLPGGDGHYV